MGIIRILLLNVDTDISGRRFDDESGSDSESVTSTPNTDTK